MLTGLAKAFERRKGMVVGVDEYMTEPCRWAALLERVDKALGAVSESGSGGS